MKKIILTILFLLIYSVCSGTPYNAYFSNTGTDTPVDLTHCNGSDSANTCSTLAHARTYKNLASVNDTVNLYFDRGDIWTANTGINRIFVVSSSNPAVNIDAYGSGDRPIFDGNVSDFSTAAVSGTGGYYHHIEFIRFERTNCSVKNIELRNVYGNGIRVSSSNTVSYCVLHNIGYAAIVPLYGVSNCLVEKNIVYTVEELYRNGKVGFWAGGIVFHTDTGSLKTFSNNLIRYNVVYDIYGEGISNNGGIIEYNIIGDTGSAAISAIPSDNSPTSIIARYNFVTMSNSSTYKIFSGSQYDGMYFFDENNASGDNSNLIAEYYGNVLIGRKIGIRVANGNNTKELRIYNNTVIDSASANLVVNHLNEFQALRIENNAFILYDNTGGTHAENWYGSPPGSVVIDNNAFFTKGGSPPYGVGSDFQTNYVTGDPKLYGEDIIGRNWDGLDSGNPRLDGENAEWIDLKPLADSSLIDSGKTLPDDNYSLTTETDFDTLPDTPTFVLLQHTAGRWEIGAYGLGLSFYDWYPTPMQTCADSSYPYDDPQDVAMGGKTSANANCRYEAGSCPATYNDLAGGSQMTTGEGTTSHEVDISQTCGNTTKYRVVCQNTSTGEDSPCTEINISVSSGAGVAPQPKLSIVDDANGIDIIECSAGQSCADVTGGN